MLYLHELAKLAKKEPELHSCNTSLKLKKKKIDASLYSSSKLLTIKDKKKCFRHLTQILWRTLYTPHKYKQTTKQRLNFKSTFPILDIPPHPDLLETLNKNLTACYFISAPDFVSSMAQGDFVYFFFRETAVEYINCGKVGIITSYPSPAPLEYYTLYSLLCVYITSKIVLFLLLFDLIPYSPSPTPSPFFFFT